MRSLSAIGVGLALVALLGAATAGQSEPLSRPPTLSAGCGTSEVEPGSHQGSMSVGDIERSWLLRVPAAYDGEAPLPLVILFHGGLEDAASILSRTGFSRLGEEEGFIVVAPQDDAYPSMWMWQPTDPQPDLALTDPDIAFVDALYERLGADLCLDLGRVYATGESNGGSASSVLGCMMDDRIAAIAPVAMALELGNACGSNRPVPVLAFHGLDDDTVIVDGGWGDWILDTVLDDGTRLGDSPYLNWSGHAVPIPDRLSSIARRYGCEPDALSEMITPSVERLSWTCPEGTDVELILAAGHGHSWPGSVESADWALTTMEIDASEMIWEFFEQHPIPE